MTTNNYVELERLRGWYRDLSAHLGELDAAQQDEASFYNQIQFSREGVLNLQAAYCGEFPDRDEEIVYYMEIWPAFYSKLFYYLLLQRFMDCRRLLPAGATGALVEAEERRVIRFFRRHQQLWRDYKCNARWVRDAFTRETSALSFFEPLSPLLDMAGTTLASYRVAWGLAYEQYREWLGQQGDRADVRFGARLEWREPKTAAAELIKALAEKQSVYLNGKPAPASKLRAGFEQLFGLELKDFDNSLYNMDTLKIDDTPFLSDLRNTFLAWKRRLGKRD
jgi:hypothetical protein